MQLQKTSPRLTIKASSRTWGSSSLRDSTFILTRKYISCRITHYCQAYHDAPSRKTSGVLLATSNMNLPVPAGYRCILKSWLVLILSMEDQITHSRVSHQKHLRDYQDNLGLSNAFKDASREAIVLTYVKKAASSMRSAFRVDVSHSTYMYKSYLN